MNVWRTARSMLFGAALSVTGASIAQPVIAQGSPEGTIGGEITLKSSDGFTQLRGRLQAFDGAVYTIETVIGTIQVDALQVTCEGDACPQDFLFGAEFGIHGSNTVGAELMPALIEGYADTLDASVVIEVGQGALQRTVRIIHDDGREMAAIDLMAEGSSSAFRSLGESVAEIGMSARRMRDPDLGALSEAGIGELRDTEQEHILALDGLIVIVHPDNPVRALSLEEIALIFGGVVTNWAQVGGRDAPISLYARDEPSGTFQTFGSLVLAPFGVGIDGAAQRFVSNIRLSDSVASDPNGIGVTAAAYARASKALPIRQDCGILSYPTTFAMKAEEYPLSRRLYLYAKPGQLTAHARQIIEFAKSEGAQMLIAEAGFVNQEVERLAMNAQGARLVHGLTNEPEVPFSQVRQMLSNLSDGERLSTTLRFQRGTTQLTPKSQLDVERLAADIAAGVFGQKEIVLVGFTDSVGQFNLNLGLSIRRAAAVEGVLRTSVAPGALDGAAISVEGYGELLPVGCNTNPQGRGANRRVEVWVRDPR
ncbi:MAG: phosphate ABC transporter substrate-binding/OmpA family protein [Pseudomonadota bacterium]